MRTASWVVVRRSDGAVRCETFKASIVEVIARSYPEYRAIPIMEYLCTLNAAIKLAGGRDPVISPFAEIPTPDDSEVTASHA